MPFHWLVRRELTRLEDPRYLRAHGVVIASPGAIEAHSESIGRYADREIWRTLTFKGMVYRFERVVPAGDRELIGAGELYLEPGLVYVAV